MERYPASFLKYISILQRNTSRYFDIVLERYHIGSGQQFFLRHIYENEGISMYDLAQIGQFDKGTVTKAVQKLHEQGYVNIEVDQNDKRVKHLYATQQAKEVLEFIYAKRDLWKDELTKHISPEQEKQMDQLLKQMAEISCKQIHTLAQKTQEKYDGSYNE